MRVVKRPAASLRVCLMTLLAPSRNKEMSAPETGLPLLSTTVPVIVAKFPLLAFAIGTWAYKPAENATRSRLSTLLPIALFRNIFPVCLIGRPPYGSRRETLEAIDCDCGLRKIGRSLLKISHAFFESYKAAAP